MKVVLFNGSPKENGNTSHALQIMAKKFNEASIETEMVHVGKEAIRGCLACNHCVKSQNNQCVITKDPVNSWIEKMMQADAIVISSPVYFAGINGTMKSFLDRAFYVISVNGSALKYKPGASIVAVRRTGGMPAVNGLNQYLQYGEMILPTANYWGVVHGTKPGDVLKDEEGIQILEVMAENMIHLLKAELRNEPIKTIRKKYTNFIR